MVGAPAAPTGVSAVPGPTTSATGPLVVSFTPGESAFTAALKRWKGREERAIRDRVAMEQLA